jgi:hypothetical protein
MGKRLFRDVCSGVCRETSSRGPVLVITAADLPKYRKLDVTRHTPTELFAVLQNMAETDKSTPSEMYNWSKAFKFASLRTENSSATALAACRPTLPVLAVGVQ